VFERRRVVGVREACEETESCCSMSMEEVDRRSGEGEVISETKIAGRVVSDVLVACSFFRMKSWIEEEFA
jgi:hypothetical protein